MGKILKDNVLALQHRGLIPGVDVPVDEAVMRTLIPEKASRDGYCIRVGTEVLASPYSEKRFVEKQLLDFKPEERCFYILVGTQSGLLLTKLWFLLPKSSYLLLVEPNSELFYAWCMTHDMSQLLKSERFRLLLNSDLLAMGDRLRFIFSTILVNYDQARVIRVPQPVTYPTVDVESWCKALEKEIVESCLFTQYVINTVDVSIRNYFANLPIGVRSMDWDGAKKSMQGKPLLLMGMGPSIHKEYDRIKELQDRVYIGCVDHGLRPALEHGIVPDFVFAVDWQERTEDFYRDLAIHPDTVLVTLFGSWPGTINKWPGRLLFMASASLRPLLYEFYPQNLPMFHGNNVGQLAVWFGMLTDAAPVYLAGYDMCYPMASSRHPHAIHFNEVYSGVSRHWSVEAFEYSFIHHNSQTLQRKDAQGRKVFTSISLESGRVDLESAFVDQPATRPFYNLNPEAFAIKGVATGDWEQLRAVAGQMKTTFQMEERPFDINTFSKTMLEKRDQVLEYYDIMEEMYHLAEDVQPLWDTPGPRLDFLRKQFFGLQKRLAQKQELAWYENLLVEMDRRMIINAQRAHNMIQAAKDENTRLKGMVELVMSNYPVSKPYRDFFKKYLKDLAESNSENL